MPSTILSTWKAAVKGIEEPYHREAPRFRQIINKDVIDLLQPSPQSSLKLHLPGKKLFCPLSPQSYCPPGPRQPLIYSLPL